MLCARHFPLPSLPHDDCKIEAKLTMGVSPFSLFIRDPKVKAALKGLPIVKRGKKSGELYRALSVADKAALVKKAKSAPAFKRTKVAKTVLAVARARKVPATLVKKH